MISVVSNGRLQGGDARLHLARPVGIDQAAGRGRAADADDQDEGDDAQKAQPQAAAAAPLALRGQVSGDVLDGLLVGLHRRLRRNHRFHRLHRLRQAKISRVLRAHNYKTFACGEKVPYEGV